MGIGDVITKILGLINTAIIPLLFAIATVYFFWGLVKYIQGGGADAKADAVKIITSGLIGLFVMTAVWGLVAMVGNTVGIQGGSVTIPTGVGGH